MVTIYITAQVALVIRKRSTNKEELESNQIILREQLESNVDSLRKRDCSTI